MTSPSKFAAFTRFRLIGQTTEFQVREFYLAAGFIPTVYGETDDKKFSTRARVEDVLPIPQPEVKV